MKRIVAIFLVFYSIPVWSYLFIYDFSEELDKVIIDPGHGGKDPGNLGTGRYLTKEKDIVLEVSLMLGNYIKENFPKVDVIYTRNKDVFPKLYERTALANREKADLFISIHCDAFTDSQAYGCSSFVVGMNHGKESRVAIKENPVITSEEDKFNYGNFDINSPEYQIEVSLYQKLYEKNSLLLAEKIQTQFRERVKRRDRGVKRAPLYVTSRVAMPSVLVELGFLTNPNEEDFLNTTDGKTYMASAIFRAFKEYKYEQDKVLKDVDKLQKLVNVEEDNKFDSTLNKVDKTTYLSVQVFSTFKKLNKKDLEELVDPFYIVESNMYKYFSGRFKDIKGVKIHQNELINMGYNDCFIVGVHNGVKIDFFKALELLK